MGIEGMSLKNIKGRCVFFLNFWENIIHFDKKMFLEKYEQMCYAYVYIYTK